MMKRERKERDFLRPFLIHLLCVAAVMAAAVFVRAIPGSYMRSGGQLQEAYTDDDGLPYLTDLDAYYHTRLVSNYLRTGSLGDDVSKSGEAWDTKSHYPEGKSADYQPGIVWLTTSVWRVFGGNLADLEYRIGAFVAALAAVAAYIFGWRLCRVAGGLACGLLVGCAPLYAVRTCFGRFDTDMFIVLMEVLLILFAMEALRASAWRTGLLFAAGFALCAVIYSLCWIPKYSMLFVGLTLFGGFLSCFAVLFDRSDPRPRAMRFFRQPGLAALAAAGVMCALGLLLFYGPSIFLRIFRAFSFSTSASGSGADGAAVLPNLWESIAELYRAPFFPNHILSAFSGYLSGTTPAVVNGLGGVAVLILCLAGLIWLLLSCLPRCRNRAGMLSICSVLPARVAAVCFCILGCWLIAGLYLPLRGIRFAEHLSISVGLLAGCFIGAWFCEPGRDSGSVRDRGLVRDCGSGKDYGSDRNHDSDRDRGSDRKRSLGMDGEPKTAWAQGIGDGEQAGKAEIIEKAAKTKAKKKERAGGCSGHDSRSGEDSHLSEESRKRHHSSMKKRIVGLVCGALAVIPTVSGAILTVADNHPSVSDASVKAMRFLDKSAEDQEAVIASWWDMGYFYESESGHPCLWDGGSQYDSVRGLLVAKALTADDLDLSRRILLMLSGSGNSAVEFLMQHTDTKTAFETLYETIVLEKEDALAIMQSRCGLNENEAQEAWALMRPATPKETYLILTYTMTRQIGWYEYYAGWDFTGTQAPPSTTLFTYTPEGTPLFRSEEGQEYLSDVREKEMIWRLFFNAEPTPCFTPVYEWHDGLEHVRVWKVEG